MRSAGIWPNSASSRPRAATARLNCCRLLAMRRTTGSLARFCLDLLARQYLAFSAEVSSVDKRIHAWHRSCEQSRRLEGIPGIGPIVATALVAEVGDWKAFSSGRPRCLDRFGTQATLDRRQGTARLQTQRRETLF